MRFKGLAVVLALLVALPLAACKKREQKMPETIIKEVVVAQKDLDLKAGIPEEFAGLLMLSPGIDRTWPGIRSLYEKVHKDLAALKSAFINRSFSQEQADSLPRLLQGRRAIISGKNFRLAYGRDSVDFWKSISPEGTDLSLKIASVYISNVGGPHPQLPSREPLEAKYKAEDNVYDAVAYVVVEIHAIAKTSAGQPVHNDTYEMVLVFPHRWNCPWEN
jgi:hypothetical protein